MKQEIFEEDLEEVTGSIKKNVKKFAEAENFFIVLLLSFGMWLTPAAA